MDNLLIISERAYERWPSFDLVYEWEDELLKTVPGAKLYKNKEFLIKGKRIFGFIDKKTGLNPNTLFTRNNRCFHFDMSAKQRGDYTNSKNNEVCIVDFYLKVNQLPAFYKAYANVKKLFVSSCEVYEFLLANNPEREVSHMPLTLPDKYRLNPGVELKKEYDLVLVGRQNPVLFKYLEEYIKSHPLKYVYRKNISAGRFPYYTNQGEYVGNIVTRDDYFALLRKSKIAFYSTPGIDGGEKRTNGFNQVTPRFLEELSCGCNIISRFEDNADTDYFQLGKMTKKVTDYKSFKRAMDECLATPPNINEYAKYLKGHYTSAVARLLV